MLYGFLGEDDIGRRTTYVAAADRTEEYRQWVAATARPATAGREAQFEHCRQVRLRELMTDMFRGLREPIWGFAHFDRGQQERFVQRHAIKIMTPEQVKERHQDMLLGKDGERWIADAAEETPENKRTIAEVIGEPLLEPEGLGPALAQAGLAAGRPADETGTAGGEKRAERSPIGVVDVRVTEHGWSVNSIYRGVNSEPDLLDEAVGLSREQLLVRYPHALLPEHSHERATLVRLAREIVGPRGWFHILDLRTVVFQFQGEQHRFRYAFNHIGNSLDAEAAAAGVDVAAAIRARPESQPPTVTQPRSETFDLTLRRVPIGDIPVPLAGLVSDITDIDVLDYPLAALADDYCIVPGSFEVIGTIGVAAVANIRLGTAAALVLQIDDSGVAAALLAGTDQPLLVVVQ